MLARRSALAAMWQATRAQPGYAAVASVSGLINGSTMVFGAAAVGWATDHLILPALAGESVSASTWWTSAAFIGGISALRGTTIWVRGVATGMVQHRAQAETRRSVVRRYLELDPGWHRRRSPGQLLAHAVTDVDALWLPVNLLYFALGNVFMLLLTLGQLFWRSVGLGLVGLVLVVLVLGLNLLYQAMLRPRTREAQAARAELGSIAHESIEGGPVVRSLGLGESEATRFGVSVERLRRADVRLAAVNSVFDPLLELLPTAAVLGVLAVGTPQVRAGEMSVGDLIGIVYLFLTAAIPLSVTSRFMSLLPMSSTGKERVGTVLDHPARRTFGEQRLPAPHPLRVELRDADVVRDGHPILQNIDLEIPAGKVTAVVGTVGSGKSTLLDLAAGQVHAAQGAVLFDDVDVRELAKEAVPESVAVVSQHPFLFAESIRDNLAMSGHPRLKRPYGDDEIWEALRLASADEIVRRLPNGLDTVVGERGATLSGGQRQRICLARALVREPRLLVLDDATSALDPRVERAVLSGITELVERGGLTVLIVANRLSTVSIADQVVLVDAGRVVATGTHRELMTASANYRRIVTAYDEAAAQPLDPSEEVRDDGRAAAC